MNSKKNNNKTEEPDKEMIEQLQRLQAEFENYKKRTQKEQETVKEQTRAQLLIKILDLADNFERTLTAQANEQELKAAVEMLTKQLQKILQEEQVTEIQAKGQKLDPYKHEVLAQEKGEQDDIITEELQKGYMLKDKVLRPSRVKISRAEGKQ